MDYRFIRRVFAEACLHFEVWSNGWPEQADEIALEKAVPELFVIVFKNTLELNDSVFPQDSMEEGLVVKSFFLRYAKAMVQKDASGSDLEIANFFKAEIL